MSKGLIDTALEDFKQAFHIGQQRTHEALVQGDGQKLGNDANQGSPYAFITYPLNSTGVKDFGYSGRELVFRQTSNPYARLKLEVNGEVKDFYPGMTLRFPFSGFKLSVDSNSDTVGNAELVVVKNVSDGYGEAPNIAQRLVRATYSAVGNSGGTAANSPSAVTDGLSLEGVVGVRAFVHAALNAEIKRTKLRWWFYDYYNSLWSRVAMDAIVVGSVDEDWNVRSVAVPNIPILASVGRIFLEAYDLALDTEGGDTFVVTLEGVRR